MINQTQLLHLLRNSINLANETDNSTERQTLLSSANLVVNELLLRTNIEFYLAFYEEGLQLLSEGVSLCKSLNVDVARTENAVAGFPTPLASHLGPDFVLANIEALWEIMSDMVVTLSALSNPGAQAYLDRLNSWEVKVYAYRETMAPEPDLKPIEEAVFSRDTFADYLRKRQPGWRDLKILDITKIAGGFSKVTLLIEIEDQANGRHSLAVRAQPATNILELHAADLSNEYPIVQLAHAEGVTVAEPLWLETDSSFFGTRFMVSRKVPGRNLGDATGAREEVTDNMVRSLARESARIHNIDLDIARSELQQSALADWCNIETIDAATRKIVQFWRDLADGVGIAKSPLIERGFRWLEENIEPCSDRPSLLHGDIGLHNVLIENERVTAVLDWEVAHIGDPAEDLSWTLQCTDQYVSEERLLEMYFEAGGKPVSEYRLRYFDVFMCIRMPITALAMAKILEKRLDNAQYAIFALRFMHHNSSRLVGAIKAAEAVRNSWNRKTPQVR